MEDVFIMRLEHLVVGQGSLDRVARNDLGKILDRCEAPSRSDAKQRCTCKRLQSIQNHSEYSKAV
jgi:hypothetical protein